jgi:hypothetical protein
MNGKSAPAQAGKDIEERRVKMLEMIDTRSSGSFSGDRYPVAYSDEPRLYKSRLSLPVLRRVADLLMRALYPFSSGAYYLVVPEKERL